MYSDLYSPWLGLKLLVNFWTKKIIIIFHGKGLSQAAVRVSIKPTATAKGGKEKEISQRELHKNSKVADNLDL